MAIQNINSLNNPAAFNLDQATEDYLIQALANLGQRYSLQGDGIGIKTISFIELFGSTTDAYNPSEYIGKIAYSISEEVPSITISVENLDNSNNSLSISDNNTNYEQKLEFSSLASNELGITGYHNICVYYDDHYIVFSMVLNTSDNENAAYICEKYDKFNGELISGVRILDNSSNNKLIYLAKNSEESSTIKYDCTIFNYESSDFTIENVGNINFATSHGIDGNNVSSTYSFTPESVVTTIYKGISQENIHDKISTRTNNVFINFAKDNKEFSTPETITINNESVSNVFYGELTSISNYVYDITYLYPEVKTYFSNNHYKNRTNGDSLIFKVLEKLFNDIYDPSKGNETIYVPLDYTFEYAYNTNEPSQVYFSTHDIAVRFAPNNLYSQIQDINNVAALICFTNDVEKVSFYNYGIEYENGSDNIYSIVVKKHYDLPYINENGYWVIDGIESEIYAKGKDAGNPNIIVVNTHKDGTYEIVTAADKEFLMSMTWAYERAQIKLPKKFVKNGESLVVNETEITTYDEEQNEIQVNYVNCKFLVPSISTVDQNKREEYVEKLKYAIIFNIADLDCIDEYSNVPEALEDIYGTDGKINSIWTLNNAQTSFECKTHDNGYAIDLNYLNNMENLIGWTLNNYIPQDPDNFTFSYLVFDNVNRQTKNNTQSLFDVYPTLSNKSSEQYNQNYSNEYNIVIQYFDTLSYLEYSPKPDPNGNNISSYAYSIQNVGQSDRRYFDDWYEINGDKTSNALYGYNGGSYAEYIPSRMNYNVPILDLSEVLVKDNTVLNRTNIMSLDASGTSYYAYLGTDCTSSYKSVLVLGTSDHDINIGTTTMTSSDGYKALSKHSEFNINFDNTRISSYAYFVNDAIFETDTITYGTNWTKSCINGVSYWNTTVKPVGSFIDEAMVLVKVNQENYGFVPYEKMAYNMFIECRLDDVLISSKNARQHSSFYIGDAISLSYLFACQLMPQVFSNKDEFNSKVALLKSNNEIISYTDSNSTSYAALKVSSSNLNNGSNNNVFIGPELSVSYYAANGKVYIEIDENEKFSTISLPHRIKTNYSADDIMPPNYDEEEILPDSSSY